MNLINPRILVFLGLGSGDELTRYVKNPHPANSLILIFECDIKNYEKVSQIQGLQAVFTSPYVRLFSESNEVLLRNELSQFFKKSNWILFKKGIEFVVTDSSNVYKKIPIIISEIFDYELAHFLSDPYDAYRGVQNIFNNAPKIFSLPNLYQIQNTLNGKAGIVVSSGPSLNQALPFLKENKDKALIIACPSAVSLLLSEGIYPHAHINIERDQVTLDILRKKVQNQPYLFIGLPLVYPGCFDTPFHQAYFNGRSLISKWLPSDYPEIYSGPSAATAAFSVLSLLGCSEIFLIGQDLAYSGNGQSHAVGISESSEEYFNRTKQTHESVMWVDGNNNTKVLTHYFWNLYKYTYENDLIPIYPGKVYNVIDSAHGAKISGTQRIDPSSLTDYLSKYQKWNPYEYMCLALKKPTLQEQGIKKEILNQKIHSAFHMLSRVIKENRTFSLICKELLFHPTITNKNKSEIDKLWGQFLAQYYAFRDRYVAGHCQDNTLQLDYETFLYPIIQSIDILYQIDFFSSSQDLEGDFNEINRKLDLIFNMLKDETYWAEMMQDLISKYQ